MITGDIHGCYTEMQRLLNKSELASDCSVSELVR